MDVNACESNGSYGSGCSDPVSPFPRHMGGRNEISRGGSHKKCHSLVLDDQKRELVPAPAGVVKKNVSEAKVMLALKNHKEAERRRRQRINTHLTTLRDLVPCTDKMDKATLLAEVINQVKELKKATTESVRGLLVPMDSEELNVEPCDEVYEHAIVSFRATLCCKYRPDIFADLKQAIGTLHTVKLMKAEISTLDDWLKIVFLFKSCGDESENDHGVLSSLIYRSLGIALDKASEFSAKAAQQRKRRKVPLLESSC
ncbi:hypothetical protein SAY86_030557 [Trapa natans]|uniref:BHLH domain-containing protein n=1 Tax=Trapa natans TaxID=22666 RepID=A0AAN7MN77_TRANT|nr:hypothetical protein SAY86_030557 [Trapa natans]